MAVGDNEMLMRKVVPQKEIVDFNSMSESFSTPERFIDVIKKISGEDNLPLVFPFLPDYFKARNEGLVTNSETRDSELSLPEKLYDSETYIDSPELRGPMEEVLLTYEKERVRQGLGRKFVLGETWSPHLERDLIMYTKYQLVNWRKWKLENINVNCQIHRLEEQKLHDIRF
mgnify:CR=1 FL=1